MVVESDCLKVGNMLNDAYTVEAKKWTSELEGRKALKECRDHSLYCT